MGQFSLTPCGNNNFQLERDQVLHVKTAANLCDSRYEGNTFFAVFAIFELGGITKPFMIGSRGPVGIIRGKPLGYKN